jgi:hypothetical protein
MKRGSGWHGKMFSHFLWLACGLGLLTDQMSQPYHQPAREAAPDVMGTAVRDASYRFGNATPGFLNLELIGFAPRRTTLTKAELLLLLLLLFGSFLRK